MVTAFSTFPGASFVPPDSWKEISGIVKQSQTVTLDGNGNGVITFGTSSANQRWVVTAIVVFTNQNATASIVPVVTLALNTYDIGTMSPGNQRGTSWNGNNDIFSGAIDLFSTDELAVLFYPPPGSSSSQVAQLTTGPVSPAPTTPAGGGSVVWTSSFPQNGQYGSFTAVGTDGNTYTWNNDCWAGGAGPQTISVVNNNNWTVISNQVWNTTYYVETYPHIGWAGGGTLSSYTQIVATTQEQGPGYGSTLQWEAAFDIWLNNGNPGADSGYEVMIWTDVSNVSPDYGGHPILATPTIAGVTYNFSQQPGGNGPESIFIRQVNAPSATTDIKAVLTWLMNWSVANPGTTNYTGPSNCVVDTIEYGWEVWGTGGTNQTFTMSQFNLSFTSSAPPPPPTPQPGQKPVLQGVQATAILTGTRYTRVG